MKMTSKLQFDPTEISPKDLIAAIKAVDAALAPTFHNVREDSTRPVKLPQAVKS